MWNRLREIGSRGNKEWSLTVTLDRVVMAFAGVVLLVSLALGFFVSSWWFLLTVLVGVNLVQASFSGVCPASLAFKAMGVKPGAALR